MISPPERTFALQIELPMPDTGGILDPLIPYIGENDEIFPVILAVELTLAKV